MHDNCVQNVALICCKINHMMPKLAIGCMWMDRLVCVAQDLISPQWPVSSRC